MMEKILSLPEATSVHGKDVDHLVVLVHWLMVILLVGWAAYFVYALFRFRASRSPKADYVGVRGSASTWLEVGIATIETVLLIGFAIPLWAKVADDFPKEGQATVVRVVAEQFNWNFIYPGADGKFGRQDLGLVSSDNLFGFDKTDAATKDNVQEVAEMRVPVGKPVILNCTAKDVIHSIKIVPLRVTQDCIPGLNLPTHFIPTKEGTNQIICAQLCGNGHAAMATGRVIVQSEAAFQQWMKTKSAGGGAATTFE